MTRVYLSLGSNIDRQYHLSRALDALQKQFGELLISSVYESEAVGFNGSPFYNAAARATTSKSIEEVCATLKAIEKDNGRVHTDKKFCARTLDLDLLTYDSKITTTPVVLPREEICYNAFVLWPLAELVPNDIHPETQETYAKMWQNFDKQKQQLWPIDFTWS